MKNRIIIGKKGMRMDARNKEELIRNNIKSLAEIKRYVADNSSILMNLTISGSHLYGFNSSDSDIDYRGIYIVNTNELLGLKKPKDVLNIKLKDEINDIVLFELKKEIDLALKSNCNILEHINAKQIYNTSEFIELRRLINNAFGKSGLYNSYNGMATFNYKKFIMGGKSTTKKYLYVFRSLMAGIYVLQTGRIEPNLITLNKYFKIKEVTQLIKSKQENREMSLVPEFKPHALEDRINELFDRIDKAYEKSKIPDYPDEKDVLEINKFLLKIRKKYIL